MKPKKYLSWHTRAEKLEKEAMLKAKGYEVDLEEVDFYRTGTEKR